MSIDADIDVQAVFPHLTYFSTNVCKFTNKNKCYSKKINCTHLIQFHLIKRRKTSKSSVGSHWDRNLSFSSTNSFHWWPQVLIFLKICLIPMEMWLWSGLTFLYVFCPLLYCWGNLRCTSPCKGQLTWFRLLYSNSPKLRKTNCGRK